MTNAGCGTTREAGMTGDASFARGKPRLRASSVLCHSPPATPLFPSPAYSLSSRTTADSSASPRRPLSRSMPFLSMSQVAGMESMP